MLSINLFKIFHNNVRNMNQCELYDNVTVENMLFPKIDFQVKRQYELLTFFCNITCIIKINFNFFYICE